MLPGGLKHRSAGTALGLFRSSLPSCKGEDQSRRSTASCLSPALPRTREKLPIGVAEEDRDCSNLLCASIPYGHPEACSVGWWCTEKSMTLVTSCQQTTHTHSTADGGCLSAPAVGLPGIHQEHRLVLYSHACSYGGQLTHSACFQSPGSAQHQSNQHSSSGCTHHALTAPTWSPKARLCRTSPLQQCLTVCQHLLTRATRCSAGRQAAR